MNRKASLQPSASFIIIQLNGLDLTWNAFVSPVSTKLLHSLIHKFSLSLSLSLSLSHSSIISTAKSCGHPGDIDNGVRDGVAHTFTSRVTYSCNDGYELVGRANRYCQSNGQWSGVLPSCRRMHCLTYFFEFLSLKPLVLFIFFMLFILFCAFDIFYSLYCLQLNY